MYDGKIMFKFLEKEIVKSYLSKKAHHTLITDFINPKSHIYFLHYSFLNHELDDIKFT